MESSVCGKLIVPVIIAAVLWLLGGFVFGKEVGMICVILGIAIVGYAAGSLMNSPGPTSEK